MNTGTETETQVAPVAPRPKQKKLKPARKQVKPGDVEKKETPQTGKEYSASWLTCLGGLCLTKSS